MWRAIATITVSALVASCSASRHATPSVPATTTTIAAPANLTVVRVAAAPAQTIDGFGASGAWWPNDLVRFPPSVQKHVADMLFSPQGIALSGYRYNIGGGGVGVKTPARAPKQMPADTAGLTFVRAANDARVPILTGFVNSAPPQFTTNGKSCGGSLKPGSEAAYAQYLATIVKRLANDELRRLLPPVAQRFRTPTWMTEICCYKGSGGVATSFGAQYDPTITQGLWLADQIYDDLTIAGDSAWYWWTALSPVIGCDPKADPSCVTRVNASGFNDGLLYYDEKFAADGITDIFPTKRFYV